MPFEPIPAEKIEMLRLCLLVGRDSAGRPWTNRRLASGIGVDIRSVKRYRKAIREHDQGIRRVREMVAEGMAEARELIGIEE